MFQRHVRELMAWLRLPKDPKAADYGKYEVALSTAEQLLTEVDALTSEAVHDEGIELMTMLLHLQNSLVDGHEVSFAVQRHRAMVMAITQAPSLLFNHVASTAFAPNLSLTARLDCLDVLHDASQEMSADLILQSRELSNMVAVAAAQPPEQVGNSRRWGHTARAYQSVGRATTVAQPNRFAPHAASLLFTILAEYRQPNQTVANLRTEPVFLAKLLRCLGMVIQSARHALASPRMAQRLGEFCWHLRLHTDASVRRGVLLVYARVVHAGEPEVPTRTDIVDWLEDALLQETDEVARDMARSLHCLLA